MRYQIGFIGCGNMASAMIGGMVSSGVCSADAVIAADLSEAKLIKMQAEYGIATASDNLAAVDAKYLVLAIKPFFYKQVIDEIKDHLDKDTVIVSITPNFSLEQLTAMFGKNIKIIRCMPNTPAMVGAGMTAYVCNSLVSSEEKAELIRLFSAFGEMEDVEERYMDAVVAVSGSSPAYVFMFIEAMADAAVLEGMPRDKAYRFAAQAVLGSAKMVMETGKHPAELKDMVCSPAGTTIEAVKVLEREGMRAAVMDAMHACAVKCKK